MPSVHTTRTITAATLTANQYTVTQEGAVISTKYRQPRALKQAVNQYGYRVVNLRLNGKSELWLVHRLVACVHLPQIEGKPYVNHIIPSKDNNAASNLEWCTHRENMEHALINNCAGALTRYQ